MNLLFFTHAEPKFLPPVIIDPSETVCGPRYNTLRSNGRYRFMNTPGGAFDAQQVFAKIRQEDFPDVVLVHADSTAGCTPRNLPDNSIKVLLVGDTHHLSFPIQNMIRYAGSEDFDAIVLWNRQHAHFFTELGFQNVFWMPGLTFAVPTVKQSAEKTNELCFFGQLGKHHPRRTRIIKSVVDAKIDITGGTLPRRDSLELVAHSRASLNVSLNGEFNLRVFESTQNGALLYTDQVSEFAGLNHFYQDGKSVVTYSDAEELIESLKYYTGNQESANRTAAEGQNVTNHYFSFSARRDAFFNLLNNGDALDAFRLKDEHRCLIQASSDENKNATLRRVQIYEWAQEFHRKNEQLEIFSTAGATPFIASDLADLVRAKQSIAIDEEIYNDKIQPLMKNLKVENLDRINPQDLISKSCDLLITSESEVETLTPILQRGHSAICIWNFDPNNNVGHRNIINSGYVAASDTPPGFFQRSGQLYQNPHQQISS